MAKLRPRDTAELAVWISDSDPPGKLKWWKEEEAPRRFKESAEAARVKLGPIRFYELQPGEDRAGTPPDNIQGINVRLLVAEADVLGFLPMPAPEYRFTDELKFEDLQKMRAATRRGYGPVLAADGKSYRPLRDDECDKIINQIGPEAAAREAMHATKH